jgi:hypothetical protein
MMTTRVSKRFIQSSFLASGFEIQSAERRNFRAGRALSRKKTLLNRAPPHEMNENPHYRLTREKDTKTIPALKILSSPGLEKTGPE